MSSEELKLIKLAQEGNEEAWSSLVERYSNLVWFAISKFNFTFEMKEDILQEVFIRLADCIKMYNPDKAGFSTFITVITKRKCIDNFRKIKKYNQEISIDSEKLFNIPYINRKDSNENIQDTMDNLQSTIEKELNPEQTLVIKLFYLQKCSYAQISEIMNKDNNWVKNTLYQTRLYLKQILNK